MRLNLFVLLILFFLYPSSSFSHGVRGSIDSGGVVITAEYSDGEAMSYAETEISAPDSELPFSSGWTDRNGRFCFYPDVTGEYRVTVKDGMGHNLELNVPVSNTMKSELSIEKKDGNGIFSYWERVFMGLSIIFFVFGFVFWRSGSNQLSKSD